MLHVPEFKYSLLSVSSLDKLGCRAILGNGVCEISKSGSIVLKSCMEGSLYVMKAMKPPPVTNGKAHLTSLQLWHERVGHLDHRGISEMTRKGVVHGMNISVQNANGTCEACILGKAHRYEIPKVRSTELSKGVPDLVHSDVYGPMQVPSIGGSRYGITFTDDHSHWTVTYPMREKGEAI